MFVYAKHYLVLFMYVCPYRMLCCWILGMDNNCSIYNKRFRNIPLGVFEKVMYVVYKNAAILRHDIYF